MYYTRNSDLSYYNKNRCRANCGSYALRLREWYDPEDYFEKLEGNVYDWVEQMALNGYDDYEISNYYIDILTEGMLNEFGDELEICDGRAPNTSDKELIAFNGMCIYDEEGSDVDFHFKVFRDGHWSEKPGSEPVKFCDLDDWGRYIGEPVYMYHRIDMKGVDDDII
jgi:hypothetical protein